MKKLLIVLFSFSIYLVSCGDNKSGDKQIQTDKSVTPVVIKDSLLPKAIAVKMIDTLKSIKLKFKDIVWSRFDLATMKNIYSDSNVVDVVYFVASITDTTSKKDKSPVIILQVKRKSSTNLTASSEYYMAGSLCPPPNDGSCGTVENPSLK